MNFALNKKIIKKVGYFDEDLEEEEDSDFCIRLRKKGYKIKNNQKAVIYHDWGNFKKNLDRGFRQGVARVKLYRKNPNELKFVNIVKNINNLYTIFYSAYILFLPITFFWPYYPLFILIPIIKKYKRNPVKEIINLAYGLGVLKELFFQKDIGKYKK